MKGDPKLIKTLNALLADELTAINQYMVHSEMCDNWGYDKLHKAIEKRAIDEMKHAEKLIGRILFLEGLPIVSDLKKLYIGARSSNPSSRTRTPISTPSKRSRTRSARWAFRSS
ncbi:MAG: bacterioferritin [Candidatus Aminicenantes bacterium]|nr:bacterioferritin [Candidatus Aminicenantes bacterium]